MPAEAPQTFIVDPGHTWLIRRVPWAFVVLAVASLAPLLLTSHGISRGTWALVGVVTLLVGAVGGYGFWLRGVLATAPVSLDDEGVWPAHRPKAVSLVRWAEIRSVRERFYLRRLDLLDAAGRPQLGVEYQLEDFERFCVLLAARAYLIPPHGAPPWTFGKRAGYHVGMLGTLGAFVLVGLYAGTINPLLGYAGMGFVVLISAHDYVTSISRLVIGRDELHVATPVRRRVIRRAQVAEVRLGEGRRGHVPDVQLLVDDARRPIHLRGLGIEAVALYQVLRNWRSGEPASG